MEPDTPQTNLLKNLSSKLKTPLGPAFLKVKTFWLNLPKKLRVATAILSGVISILIFLAIFSDKFNPLDSLKKFTQKDILTQYNEGWEKLVIPQREPAFFTLAPQTQSPYGILPQETFTLTAREPVDANFINEVIKASIPVRVTSISNKEFKIIPTAPITINDIFNVNLATKDTSSNGHAFDRNYGWTFQTQGKFKVTSSIPGDQKVNVPLNTGIEFVFSQDDYEDPVSFISIEPKIEWRGERHTNTYAVVSLAPLEPKTLYKVTLKKGLNLDSRNDPLTEDYTFSFQTEEKIEFQNNIHPPRISLSKNFIQTSPNEPAAVAVYTSNWKSDVEIKTQVFKFESIDQFLNSRKKVDEILNNWYTYFAEEEAVDTSNLSRVAETQLKVQTQTEIQNKFEYLQLPENLSQGFYLVQFWYENGQKLEQLWVQSTNVSAFTSVGRKHTLVWANNVEDSQPVEGAVVTPINSGGNYTTNITGVATFTTPQSFFDQGLHYLTLRSSQGDLVLPVNSLKGNAGEKQPNDYWSYLYNERRLYKPGDTLYFWGAIKDRDTASVPAQIRLNISAGFYGYGYSRSESADLVSVKITPSEDGSFIGNIPLQNIPEGSYVLTLTAGDVQVTQTGFQITQYEKPEIKIEVTSDKNAVFTGENVNFTAKASFFDGTPAKNILLKIYEQRTGKVTEIETDVKGQINYTYQPKYQDSTSYNPYPRYESVTITPKLAETAKVEGSGSVYVFGAKLMLETVRKQENDKASFTAQINKVNLDNINKGISFDVKSDPVLDKEINVVITKTWWEKIETGTYYDFIEKVTRPTYRYDRHDEKVNDFKLKTNSDGKISHEFTLEKEKSYQVALSFKDVDGHPITGSLYFYYYEGHETPNYDEFSTPELNLGSETNEFSTDETVNLTVDYKGERYPNTDKNRFLFILAQRGTQDFFVQDSPEFSFPFQQKHVPNTYAAAVIFSGSYYQIAQPYCQYEWRCSFDDYYYEENYFNSLEIRFREKDKELDLAISLDKEKYTPGETARVTVTVKKSDQPDEESQVNLVLVDQALAAIGGVNTPSVLPSLYKSVPNEIYYTYYSHKPLTPKPAAAEKGGGGGENREIFKDTAFFGQARTNEKGQATFEFTLPDDITTWIIYAQGLNAQLDAGQVEGKLVTSKDFFVTSNFPPEYLLRDTAFVTGNGFGNKIESNQSINYQVTISQNDSELVRLTGEGKSLKDVSFQFPKLVTGDYKVWLRGETEELIDGVTYPFKVIDSRLDLQLDNKYQIEKGSTLDSLNLGTINEDQPIHLVLTDIGKGKYYRQLSNYCYLASNRLEKRIAKIKADQILDEKFEDNLCAISDQELSSFQNFDGGLSQVSWGGSNLETTVWAIFTDPSAFDKEKLITYLEGKFSQGGQTNSQRIFAAWGLSLLGQAHFAELQALSQNSGSFDDKVIAGLALASLGETEMSRDIYYDLLADYAYTNKPYIRIQAPATNAQTSQVVDKYVKDSSLTLLLGSMVEKNYNEGLFTYIRDYQNQIEDVALDLAKIAFVTHELEKLPNEDTSISFTSNSRELSFDLVKGKTKKLTLLKGEHSSSKLTVTKGKVEATTFYSAVPGTLPQINKDNRLTIKRSFKKVKGTGSDIHPADIVEVTVIFDLDEKLAPLGGYTITDHLPSGLIYLNNPHMYGLKNADWIQQVRPNVIKYRFCNSPWWQMYGQRSFTYYARATAVGTYVAEPTLFQSLTELSVLQLTPEDSVTIEALN